MSFVKKVIELREYKDTVIIPYLEEKLREFIRKYAISRIDFFAKKLIILNEYSDNFTVSIKKDDEKYYLYLHSYLSNIKITEDININFNDKIDEYDFNSNIIKHLNEKIVPKLLVEIFTEVFDGAKIEYCDKAEYNYHILYVKFP
jgi:hypothetical protein